MPAQRGPGLRLGHGPKFIRVHPAGHDMNLGGVRSIQLQEIVSILWTFSDDAVCRSHHLLLNRKAHIGKLVGLALMLSPHLPQGMKRHHKGSSRLLLDLVRH